MENIKRFIKENKTLVIILAVVVLVIVVYLIFRNPVNQTGNSYINETNQRTQEIQTDVLTGKVAK